jgi:hypothetical protein
MDTLAPGKYRITADVQLTADHGDGYGALTYPNGTERSVRMDRYNFEPLLADEPEEDAVVLDADGDAWQRDNDGWYLAGGTEDGPHWDQTWKSLIERFGPFKVIYAP